MEGYVVQEHTIDTIEHNLFEALHKVCFIEKKLLITTDVDEQTKLFQLLNK